MVSQLGAKKFFRFESGFFYLLCFFAGLIGAFCAIIPVQNVSYETLSLFCSSDLLSFQPLHAAVLCFLPFSLLVFLSGHVYGAFILPVVFGLFGFHRTLTVCLYLRWFGRIGVFYAGLLYGFADILLLLGLFAGASHCLRHSTLIQSGSTVSLQSFLFDYLPVSLWSLSAFVAMFLSNRVFTALIK